MFCHVEQEKQKKAEALKGIKIEEFKNWSEQWEKSPHKCFASNAEYFTVTEFKHVGTSRQFFINKLLFWSLPHVLDVLSPSSTLLHFSFLTLSPLSFF